MHLYVPNCLEQIRLKFYFFYLHGSVPAFVLRERLRVTVLKLCFTTRLWKMLPSLTSITGKVEARSCIPTETKVFFLIEATTEHV